MYWRAVILFSLVLFSGCTSQDGAAPVVPAVDETPSGDGGTKTTPVFMPGTQPEDATLQDVAGNCVICHSYANYSAYTTWYGAMMAQAARDPLAFALIAVQNKITDGKAGDFCLRCHTPGGWLGGRSEPGSGERLEGADFEGVKCDLCHRLVDPFSDEGKGLVEPDVTVPGSGRYVVDPVENFKRGSIEEPQNAPHKGAYYEFQMSSELCRTCHEIENPLYDPPVPVERTWSEWKYSDFSREGIQCQDCHMSVIDGFACSWNFNKKAPERKMSLHTFIGGNAWIPEVLPLYWMDYTEEEKAILSNTRLRAIEMLNGAATVSASASGGKLSVKVTNLAGHKLPTGFTEGRRMWINVKFIDAGDNTISESGKYEAGEGELIEDHEIKVYEITPGVKGVKGYEDGHSFNFILNNHVYKDNRIPARGFTNAEYEEAGAYIVGATYADGQNWDVTEYTIPAGAVKAEVALFYQTSSKEFIEFLRDENVDNEWDVFGAGAQIYDLWINTGKSTPVEMAGLEIDL